jgi:uncharacterized protein (TIGR02001 family)
MKNVFMGLTTCLIAGSFVSAHADPLLEHTVAPKQQPTVTQKTSFKDAVVKDQKANDGLWWMDNLTGNLTWVSNYVFRGISQTRNLPAIQGGLTYTFPIGIYANMWGSNVKFDGSDATIEIDTVLGYSKTISDFTFNVNVARYNYPGDRILNYNEINTLFNYKFLQLGISYSGDVYGVHQSGTYYQGGVNWDIPSEYLFNVNGVNFTALYGHYNLPEAAGNTYNDYLVSLGKSLRNYTASIIWTSTNGAQHASPIDGSTFTAQLAADF